MPETTSGEADPTETPEADAGADDAGTDWAPSAPPEADETVGEPTASEASLDDDYALPESMGGAEPEPAADALTDADADADANGLEADRAPAADVLSDAKTELGDGVATGSEPAADILAPAPANRDRSGSIRAAAAAKAAAAVPTAQKSGRATPKGGSVKQAPKPGRYTPPIPKEQRQSPRWFPGVLLGFLVLGLLTIVLNYVNVLPGGTNNWYLISGIVFIVVGLFMATFYH